jgi:hypothetical protein
MSASCPACGVAVLPGYARCPKCRRPLPSSKIATAAVGGTAIASTSRKLPLVAVIAVAVIGGGIIAYIGLRSTSAADKPAPEPTATDETPAEDQAPPSGPIEAPNTEPSPEQLASRAAQDLERTLKRKRLWSTVSIIGDKVDIRSGSCDDPAMTPVLDEAVPSLKAAGLTKMRCLEQSGRVVSDRDL